MIEKLDDALQLVLEGVQNLKNAIYMDQNNRIEDAAEIVKVGAERIFWLASEYDKDLSQREYIDEVAYMPKKWYKAATAEDKEDVHFESSYLNNILHIKMNHRLPTIRTQKAFLHKYSARVRKVFKAETIDIDAELCDVVMVFINHYKKDSIRFVRDNDNYYTKLLSDCIAAKYMAGLDGPSNVQYAFFSIPEEENYTEVYVVPREVFPEWIEELCRY